MPFDFVATVETLDAVPEPFRGMYVKPEGGNSFAIHPDFQSHIGGLTSALDKERKSIKTFNQQLAAWKALGETPEAITAKMAELTEAATKGAEGKTNWEKMKADLDKGYATQLSAKDQEVVKMRTTVEKHLIDNVAITALTDAKGSPALLLPHVRSQVKVFESNGEYVVRVVDKDGDPRGDGKGGYMSIKDLVGEMKASNDFGRAFEATGTSGGGKPPGTSKIGTDGGAGRNASDMTSTQKIALGLSKGQLGRA